MVYVEQQTSAQLRAHMRSLKKMHGWHEPLADRLFREVEAQDAEIERLRAREDRLLRLTIDATWGDALEDGSVPATKKQDWIIDYARAGLAAEQQGSA